MWLLLLLLLPAFSDACVTSLACGVGGVCVSGGTCVCVGPWSVNASTGACDVPVLACGGYASPVGGACVCPRNRQGLPLCAACAPGFTGTQCAARTAFLSERVLAFFSATPSPPTGFTPAPVPSAAPATSLDDRTRAIVAAVVTRAGVALCAVQPRGSSLVPVAFVVTCIGCIVVGGAVGVWLSIWARSPRKGVQMYEKV